MKLLTFILLILISATGLSQNAGLDDNLLAYRVVAYQNNNNSVVSESNIIHARKRLHIHVPNAFSPDGDGINDEFRAISDGVHDYRIDIYNRWGEVVYHSTDIQQSWNGEFKGTQSMQDAYVYVIKARGEGDSQSTTLKGTVSLIR